MSEPIHKMALHSLPVAAKVRPTGVDELGIKRGPYHDYSHLLSPEQRSGGFTLRLTESYKDLYSTLEHNGAEVGVAIATKEGPTLHIDASDLEDKFHNQKLGTAMYEALYSHAYHKMPKVKTVAGSNHTLEANRVHESLARKHGLRFVSHRQAVDDPMDYTPYAVPIRKSTSGWSYPLEKAIGDIGPGIPAPEFGPTSFDYSHMLTPEHDQALPGGRIIVYAGKERRPGGPFSGRTVSASIRDHQGFDLAHVDGVLHKPDATGRVPFQITSASSQEHLPARTGATKLYWGRKLYEAAMAYVHQHHGATHVIGGAHSSFAHKAHAALAEKHGMKYDAMVNVEGFDDQIPSIPRGLGIKQNGAYNEGDYDDVPDAPYDDKFGPYQYTIKSEEPLSFSSVIPGRLKRISDSEGVPYAQFWDYTHLLSPEQQKAGYELELKTLHPRHLEATPNQWRLVIKNENAPDRNRATNNIGNVLGNYYSKGAKGTSLHNSIEFDYANIYKPHRGQHIGRAAYEAIISHFRKHHGAEMVVGGTHSSSANTTHQAIANKYGLEFKHDPVPSDSIDWETDEAIPQPLRPDPKDYGSFDQAFGHYAYKLQRSMQAFGMPLAKIEEDPNDPVINKIKDPNDYVDMYEVRQWCRAGEWNENRMAALLKYKPGLINQGVTTLLPHLTKDVWDYVFKDVSGNLALTNPQQANAHRHLMREMVGSASVPWIAADLPSFYKEAGEQAKWDEANPTDAPTDAADRTAETMMLAVLGGPEWDFDTSTLRNAMLANPEVIDSLPLLHKVGQQEYRMKLLQAVKDKVETEPKLKAKVLDYFKALSANLERFASTSTRAYRGVRGEYEEALPLLTPMIKAGVPETYIKKATKKGLWSALLTQAPNYPKRKFDAFLAAVSGPDAKGHKIHDVQSKMSNLLMASPHITSENWVQMVKAFPDGVGIGAAISDPRWNDELANHIWDIHRDPSFITQLGNLGKLTVGVINHMSETMTKHNAEAQGHIDSAVAKLQGQLANPDDYQNRNVQQDPVTGIYKDGYRSLALLYQHNPFEYNPTGGHALIHEMHKTSLPMETIGRTIHELLDQWEKASFYAHHAGLHPAKLRLQSNDLFNHPWELMSAVDYNAPPDVNMRLAMLGSKHSWLFKNDNSELTNWFNSPTLEEAAIVHMLQNVTNSGAITGLMARSDAKPEWANMLMARPEFAADPAPGDDRFAPNVQRHNYDKDKLGREFGSEFRSALRSAVLESPGITDTQLATFIPGSEYNELYNLCAHANFGDESFQRVLNAYGPEREEAFLVDATGAPIYDDNGDTTHRLIDPGNSLISPSQKLELLSQLLVNKSSLFNNEVWDRLIADRQLEDKKAFFHSGREDGAVGYNAFLDQVAQNHNTPTHVLDYIWNGGADHVPNGETRSVLLQHPNARPTWIDEAIDGPYDVRLYNKLTNNKALSDEQLSRMMLGGGHEIAQTITQHENAGPLTVGQLVANPNSYSRYEALGEIVKEKPDLLTDQHWRDLAANNSFDAQVTHPGYRNTKINNPLAWAAATAASTPQEIIDAMWANPMDTSKDLKPLLMSHAKARPEWIQDAINSLQDPNTYNDKVTASLLKNPNLTDDQVAQIRKGVENFSGPFMKDDGSPAVPVSRSGIGPAWMTFLKSDYGQGDWAADMGKKMQAYDKAQVAAGGAAVWWRGEYGTHDFVKQMLSAVEMNDPDSYLQSEGVEHSSVQVHPGSQLHRAVRDMIAKNGAPMPISSLPPGPNYNKYQMVAPMSDEDYMKIPEKRRPPVRPSKKTGLVSVENMEQAITDLGDDPQYRYNVTHGEYGPGTQSDSSNVKDEVFQLNINTDKVKQLKAAGIWPLFLSIQRSLQVGQGGHPQRATGLGWFRHRKVTPQKTMHLTELQSDIRPHGTSWSYFWNQFQGGSVRTGRQPQFMHHITSKFDKTNFPGDKLDLMHNILFGPKNDPAMIMIDALHQHLRDKGHHDVTIYTPSSEWRSKLSGFRGGTPSEKDIESLGRKHMKESALPLSNFKPGHSIMVGGVWHTVKTAYPNFTYGDVGTGIPNAKPEQNFRTRKEELIDEHEIWMPGNNNGGWHKLHDVDPVKGQLKYGIDRIVAPFTAGQKFLSRSPANPPLHIPRVYDDEFRNAGYNMRAAKYGDEPTQLGTHYGSHSIKGNIEDLFHTSLVRKYDEWNYGWGLEKAISRLKPPALAQRHRDENEYDANSFLTPAHLNENYHMVVRSGINSAIGPWMSADLYHHGLAVGGTTSYIGDERFIGGKKMVPMTIDFADIHDPSHRSKGLGVAMYEALLSHGYGRFGATHVIGQAHSTMAHRVHEKLAEKHGLKYKALPNIGVRYGYPDKEAWDKQTVAPFDRKYGDYQYTIEPHIDEYDKPVGEETLGKMALSNIKMGTAIPKDYPSQSHSDYDYTHLLPQEYRSKGYKLHLSQGDPPLRHWNDAEGNTHEFESAARHQLTARLELPVRVDPSEMGRVRDEAARIYRQSPQMRAEYIKKRSYYTKHIGSAQGQVFLDGVLEPHFNSGIGPEHRGKGLGKALYNAVFGHAYNVLGAHTVRGKIHSIAAGRVHEALAREHGFKYDAGTMTTPKKYQDNTHLEGKPEVRTSYDYALNPEQAPAIP